MGEHTPIITKNDTRILINISKLSAVWAFGGSVLAVIVSVIIWFISVNTFQETSAADRKELWKIADYNQRMIIEINWNMKQSFRQTHPDINYDWKSYDQIKNEIGLAK